MVANVFMCSGVIMQLILLVIDGQYVNYQNK